MEQKTLKKKKSYLIFVLTTNHLSVQAIVFFGQHHHLTKTCNPRRELTYDKLFTTLISVHRMTDNKICVPVHLYYIQLSRTITGKDLISWKDVHTVPREIQVKITERSVCPSVYSQVKKFHDKVSCTATSPSKKANSRQHERDCLR